MAVIAMPREGAVYVNMLLLKDFLKGMAMPSTRVRLWQSFSGTGCCLSHSRHISNILIIKNFLRKFAVSAFTRHIRRCGYGSK